MSVFLLLWILQAYFSYITILGEYTGTKISKKKSPYKKYSPPKKYLQISQFNYKKLFLGIYLPQINKKKDKLYLPPFLSVNFYLED